MINKNTKVSDSTINDKQFKIYDFIPEFSKFRSSDEIFDITSGQSMIIYTNLTEIVIFILKVVVFVVRSVMEQK